LHHLNYRFTLLKFLYFFFLLYLVLSFSALAQYSNLLHKPYREKVAGVHAMYKDLIDIADSTQRAQKVDEIKNFARRNKDRGLELEIEFFQNFWNAFYQKQPRLVSLKLLKKQLVVVTAENIDFLKARSLRALAEFYWKIDKNYELAFEQYFLLDKELTTIKAEDYPEMARDLMQIGEAYFFFHDYELAKKYFKKTIKLTETPFNTMVINTARNTLGLCYQQTNELDSADYYFGEVQKTTFKEAAIWKRIAAGNKGNSMYLRKQYDQAIPLLEADFNGAIVDNDYGCIVGAAILLADIYREKGKLTLAGNYISKARFYIKKSGQVDRLRLLYPVMSKWYAAIGNTEKSKQYVDSSVIELNKFSEKFSALKVLKAQQKVDRQKEQLQLASFTLEKQRKINERNLMIVLVIGLFVALVLGYSILKRKQQVIEIEKLKIESELKKAQNEIDLFVFKINEQSKIAEKFNQELKKIQNSESEEKKILEKTAMELRSTKILTDEDWINFQKHFGKLYPNFIKNLKANYTTITDAEIRYLMLSKLQLSHREMAQALGISSDAVRVTWNRVRKKMKGTLVDTPQSLIQCIE